METCPISSHRVNGLQLEDVDREQGILTVRGKGSKPRRLPLGQDGLHALLSYLEPYRQERGACVEREEACEEPLFLSKAGRSLTDNGIALLFGRLRKTSWDHEEGRWRSSVARYVCDVVSASRKGSVPVAGTAGSRRERRSETVSVKE